MDEENKPQDWKIRQHYEQQEVKEKIVKIAEYREVAPTYPNGYGKRPDAINFPGDYEQLVENGAISFHGSVEKWRNPLLIDKVSDLDKLRVGWDLIIDIDCDKSFDLSKHTAKALIDELEHHGINNISAKFSGNRGFHIGIREEAFPENINEKDLREYYPALARGIVDYLRHKLEEKLKQKAEDLSLTEEIDESIYDLVDIENDWGQRHLFRLPYSLHESSWLVSTPIDIEKILEFEKKDAEIDNIEYGKEFLESYEENEATNLVVQALDFMEKQKEERKEKLKNKSEERDFQTPDEAIPEKYFPPTIKKILQGLEDGRKRALFILINFYRVTGYSWEQIENRIWEWNERNKEQLRESYIKTQLRWHKNRSEDVPPPNYDSKGYYKDMNVYEGDNLEERVDNPVSYAFRKAKKREDQDDDENNLECPYCGKKFEKESYYKKHVQKCFD